MAFQLLRHVVDAADREDGRRRHDGLVLLRGMHKGAAPAGARAAVSWCSEAGRMEAGRARQREQADEHVESPFRRTAL